MKIEIGDELIISHDIVDITGNIIFKKIKKLLLRILKKLNPNGQMFSICIQRKKY
jgi:hypothetical protein